MSAADLMFLQQCGQTRLGTSNRKRHSRITKLPMPFASKVCIRDCCDLSRTSEAGHWPHEFPHRSTILCKFLGRRPHDGNACTCELFCVGHAVSGRVVGVRTEQERPFHEHVYKNPDFGCRHRTGHDGHLPYPSGDDRSWKATNHRTSVARRACPWPAGKRCLRGWRCPAGKRRLARGCQGLAE